MLAASCTPATTPAPTATETATIVPTATSTPTVMPTPVTYLPGLSVNVPEPDAVFIQQVVNENYLSVMGLIRDQVALSYHEHKDGEGMLYLVMLDDATGAPLAVYTEGNWQKSTLKFFGRQIGIVMGTDTWHSEIVTAQEMQVFKEFDRATIEVGNDWECNEPSQGNYNMDYTQQIERVVKYLKEAGITEIVAHPLTTAGHAPWIDGSYTKDELREIMKSRVKFFIDHNPDADFIVVVNEPYLWDSRPTDVYFKAWGNSYEYIAEVFQMARDYAKEKTQEIKLIYNDSDNHYADGLSSGISRSIVSMLIEKDLIDYVGIQAHIGEWREGAFDELMVPQMPAEIEFYKKLGVPVLITELTYQPDSNSYRSDSTLAMPPAEFEKRLSHVFGEIFRIAIESGNVQGITFCGVTDKSLMGANVNWYMIFDENGQPKQAYYVVLRTLYEGIK